MGKPRGASLVLKMVAMAAVCVVAAIVTVNFIKLRNFRAENAAINNLRQINESSPTDAAASPADPGEHRVSFANACILNLRLIDSAKMQWALEHHATNGENVTMAQLTNYFSAGLVPDLVPKCHAGGTYTIGKIGEAPVCSLGTNITPAHVLP